MDKNCLIFALQVVSDCETYGYDLHVRVFVSSVVLLRRHKEERVNEDGTKVFDEKDCSPSDLGSQVFDIEVIAILDATLGSVIE